MTLRAILQRLDEATYARDKEFRDRAMRFYEALRAWIDVPVEVLRQRLAWYNQDPPMFRLEARKFFPEEGFETLVIVFTPSDGRVRASMGMVGGKPLLRLAALPDDGDLANLADRVQRETVVHEIVHMFDQGRAGKRIGASSDARKKYGLSAYYNNPREWNAFWQAGADAAEQAARTVPGKTKDYYFGDGTLRSFMAVAAERFWNTSFLDARDAKTQRKFDKRMADLWANLRDQGLLVTPKQGGK
jgi:hypothetical protein